MSFTIQVGKNERTSEVTTVYYSPTRLNFALAIPADATDVVFDENRPYLNGITAGTVDGDPRFLPQGAHRYGLGCRCPRPTPQSNGRTRNWTRK